MSKRVNNVSLLLLTLALKRKKRLWVHDINVNRDSLGEFHHLFKELEKDDVKFRKYFRLNKTQFQEVLSVIEEDIRKNDTNYRKSIAPEERLAVCLR